MARQLKIAQKNNEIRVDESYVEGIALDISKNATSSVKVTELRQKYGDLKILNTLEAMFLQQEMLESSLDQLNQLNEDIGSLTEETSLSDLEVLGSSLAALRISLGDRLEAQLACSRFSEILSQKAKALSNGFKKVLLESKWDTSAKVPSGTVLELRSFSTELFRLSRLSVEDNCNELWNFQCIANNFKIRFTYHFHDDSFNIETYFKYLDDYLTRNLYKCIYIFHDEDHGLTKQLVHEEFISHVLQTIREKVETCLLQNDMKVLISLISQILKTDKNLETSFHYHGTGMISLVPSQVWDLWLSYETETAMKQFTKLTEDSKVVIGSSTDFIKLLNKIYNYLKPFYGLEYEPLRKYKLLSCSQIFINLSSSYLDYLLSVDSLSDVHTEEEELYQTLMKLQNFNIVNQKITELSQEYIFVYLTDVVNERESKNYSTLFQNVLEEYRKVIEDSIQPTSIHRIKKLLKESLRNYFKISVWSANSNQVPDSPNSELVNAIKLMTRIISRLDSLSIPLAVSLSIKNELLNIIVNYFIESILKLNKFNEQGLRQFTLDFQAMRDSLSLPDGNLNVQEAILLELVKVLSLKYDEDCEKFYKTAYIKESNFGDLKNRLAIKSLIDSEIQDALYRIAYGNIL